MVSTVSDASGMWVSVKDAMGGGAKQHKLGAFLGVFTPSILTILGVILYLRTGWVVGSVGLLQALVIVVIANAVTFVSALSISAIATNMRVGAGGGYYIISRSLGIEVGAAIGIPLYLAMTLSVTLYAFGLAESMEVVWDNIRLSCHGCGRTGRRSSSCGGCGWQSLLPPWGASWPRLEHLRRWWMTACFRLYSAEGSGSSMALGYPSS